MNAFASARVPNIPQIPASCFLATARLSAWRHFAMTKTPFLSNTRKGIDYPTGTLEGNGRPSVSPKKPNDGILAWAINPKQLSARSRANHQFLIRVVALSPNTCQTKSANPIRVFAASTAQDALSYLLVEKSVLHGHQRNLYPPQSYTGHSFRKKPSANPGYGPNWCQGDRHGWTA